MPYKHLTHKLLIREVLLCPHHGKFLFSKHVSISGVCGCRRIQVEVKGQLASSLLLPC